ncbi:MAG: rod shape-determining protein MreD [Candidatus Omnitrophota bacterium]
MFKIRFKSIRFIIISFFTLIFQSSLAAIFSFKGIKPDLILLLVIFYSLYNGYYAGMYYGIILGFLVDCLSSGILGINSLTFGIVGLSCGLLKERVYTTVLLTKVLVAFTAGIYAILIYYFLASNFYILPVFRENFAFIFLALIYTTLTNIIFFRFLEKIVIIKQMTL